MINGTDRHYSGVILKDYEELGALLEEGPLFEEMFACYGEGYHLRVAAYIKSRAARPNNHGPKKFDSLNHNGSVKRLKELVEYRQAAKAALVQSLRKK